MKILFWNLGYARGINGSVRDLVTKGHRMLAHTTSAQKLVLDEVAASVRAENPTVFAYAEVLTGARRNQKFDQHVYLESQLTYDVAYAIGKYTSKTLARQPLHVGNGNGVCAMEPAMVTAHHFSRGGKTLILKLKTESVTLFVVHLSVLARIRRVQLQELSELVNGEMGTVVVCGDFNIFRGQGELSSLRASTGLVPAFPQAGTFPAHRPRHSLDGFLYRTSHAKQPRIRTLPLTLSDHLPVVFEW